MAVTSMWAIKERLDHVVEYVSNESKTIQTVLNYASNDSKTNDKKFVSCLNCVSKNPYESMIKTKQLFSDESKILAYHGYQAFKPGEGTADMIHEIGLKTAAKLFGDRYEVVVTTHLDKGHLHNHIVVNSTSFVDGKRFCNTLHDIKQFREVSDALCKEHGLSVIELPQGKGKRRNVYNAARSYIREIKKDIDSLINSVAYFNQFTNEMLLKGYAFDIVDDEECVIHPYFDQPIPLKMLGSNYSLEEIESRILNAGNEYVCFAQQQEDPLYIKYKNHELKGLLYEYVKFCVQIGIFPKRIVRQRLSKETRQALKKIDQFSESIRFMSKYNITTLEDLATTKEILQEKLDELLKLRKDCYKERAKCDNLVEQQKWSDKARELTPNIKILRKEIRIATNVETQNDIISNNHKQNKARENEL